MNDAIRMYMEQAVMTNHPIKNTIMIYQKCIVRLKQINKCFVEYKFSEADVHLEKLEETILELNMQVDENVYEDLARDLYKLYDWILSEVNKMKMFREGKAIPAIESVLQDLIDAYSEILKNAE